MTLLLHSLVLTGEVYVINTLLRRCLQKDPACPPATGRLAGDGPVPGFANRPESVMQASWCRDSPQGWLDQHPALFQPRQDASDHRGGDAPTFPPQQDHQLVFAPARILAAQVAYSLGQLGRPGRLPPPVRPVRMTLQARQVLRFIAAPPAIEGLPANPEMAAG